MTLHRFLTEGMLAQEQRQKRQAKMDELQAQADAWAGKLDEQDQGGRWRGRKLSDSGAKARFCVFH